MSQSNRKSWLFQAWFLEQLETIFLMQVLRPMSSVAAMVWGNTQLNNNKKSSLMTLMRVFIFSHTTPITRKAYCPEVPQ